MSEVIQAVPVWVWLAGLSALYVALGLFAALLVLYVAVRVVRAAWGTPAKDAAGPDTAQEIQDLRTRTEIVLTEIREMVKDRDRTVSAMAEQQRTINALRQQLDQLNAARSEGGSTEAEGDTRVGRWNNGEVASLLRECRRRRDLGQRFAVCFVEIDHFETYRDRCGREWSERIVALLARILQDAVRTHSTDGLIAHRHGADFVLVLATGEFAAVCGEVCTVFDQQVPQAPADRQGESTPPTKVSIGVVTNEVHHLTHFAQFIELGAEMMDCARAQSGSCFVVDRAPAACGHSANRTTS